MAIGPIGNTIFVNQMTANVASAHGNQNNRYDLQNVVAQAAANEKEEKVLEVRPAEETHKVDPDREHQKNEADQENARNEKKEESEEKEEVKIEFTLHKLDIKV
ncbi:MAG: hypothetical protein AUK54_04765 [Helicobacteraceae bacterium CG2_30_36_10]|nr:MAG: hypothetical protein AUK54_04765 [Helicobacteraceae bacterium CG2_30_36_10]